METYNLLARRFLKLYLFSALFCQVILNGDGALLTVSDFALSNTLKHGKNIQKRRNLALDIDSSTLSPT